MALYYAAGKRKMRNHAQKQEKTDSEWKEKEKLDAGTKLPEKRIYLQRGKRERIEREALQG